MVRRYVAGTAAGAALVVTLTGCLGDSGDGKKSAANNGTKAGGTQLAALQMLNRTSEQTSKVTSFKGTMVADITTAGKQMKMSGDLAYRLKPALAMKMNMKMSGPGVPSSANSLQEIVTSDAIYMKIPVLAEKTGKPWMKISFSALKGQTGMDVGSAMRSAQQADPTTNVKMLTASKDVRKVGTESVEGVSTTHYQGTYQVADGLAKLDPKTRESTQKALEQQGLKAMNFDLWVDGRQLPRKMVMKTAPGSQMQMSTEVTYRDYNKPVHITEPPASQVTDGSNKLPS